MSSPYAQVHAATVPPGRTTRRIWGNAGVRVAHEVHDELGEGGVEAVVLPRQCLRGGLSNIRPRRALARGRDKRLGRVRRGHVLRAQPRDERFGERARPAADVHHRHGGRHARELDEERCQLSGVPPHEAVVLVTGHREAHRMTVFRRAVLGRDRDRLAHEVG